MAEAAPKKWTILSVLDWTRTHFESKALSSPRLDAELLLAHALGLSRVMLYARFDQPLTPEELARIRALVARRARGEPIAYLLGEREIYSMDFEVNASVLIPRPDTETLIEACLEQMADVPRPRIVDVGTGTGCIALVLAKHLPNAEVTAIDISPDALAVARRNAARHQLEGRVRFLEGNLLDAAPADLTGLDLVVANLPYIPHGQISTLMTDVRDFEPHLALDGGEDGLDLIRRLVPEARARLAPGGSLALEIGWDQRVRVEALMSASHYADVQSRADSGGQDRVVTGRCPR